MYGWQLSGVWSRPSKPGTRNRLRVSRFSQGVMTLPIRTRLCILMLNPILLFSGNVLPSHWTRVTSVRNQVEGIALEHPRAYEGPVLACSALEPGDVRAYGRFAGTLQRRPLMDGDRLGPFNRATTP